MQFAYQFPERCERLVLGRERGARAARSTRCCAGHAPRRRDVLPLLARAPVLDAGASLGRAGRWRRPGAELARWRGLRVARRPEARQAFMHTVRSVIDVAGQRVTPATGSTSRPSCRR